MPAGGRCRASADEDLVGPPEPQHLARLLVEEVEIEPFNAATDAAARQAASLTRAGKLLSVAGGGDTVAALNASGSADDFSYVSTAGGAFLEWLEGKTLPGVAALERS